MSFYHSPKIVTNGLVVSLDAGNAKSYPGTGTVWFDKSGTSNNANLTNGPTFNQNNLGSIFFDGADDYAPTVNSVGISGNSARSMFAWVYPTELAIDQFYSVIKFGSGNQATLFELLLINDSLSGPTLVGHFWGFQQAMGAPTGRALLNNFSYVGMSYNGSAVSIFLNGVRLRSQNFGLNTTNSVMTLGRPEFSGHKYYKGNIYSAQFYNRELTDIEVQQNFNSLRGRFGI